MGLNAELISLTQLCYTSFLLEISATLSVEQARKEKAPAQQGLIQLFLRCD